MSALLLHRQHLSISRASEYFTRSELQAQTGQPADRFCSVALKELLDNALDAAETAGRRPEIIVTTNQDGNRLRLSVEDNGVGLPAEVLARILNFETRTSDKAAYRAPTRGAQGNALKTICGIPVALGDTRSRLVIESQGQRHHVEVWATPGGAVRHEIDSEPSTRTEGTRVTVDLPLTHETNWNPGSWVIAFARMNPHARLQIRENATPIEQAKSSDPFFWICQCEPSAAEYWRKFWPRDLTAAHWYTLADFARLVHLKADHNPEQRIGDLAREFRGQSRRYKAVCKGIDARTVGELASDAVALEAFHTALKEAPAPSPDVLGRIGEAHLLASFAPFEPLPDRSWYRVKTGEIDGIPFVFEIAIAETATPGGMTFGLNFSAPFGDPLSGTWIAANDESAHGTSGILSDLGVYSGQRHGLPRNVSVAAHLVMPIMPTLDRGKSRLALQKTVVETIGDTIGKAARVLHKELKAHLKNETRDRKEVKPDKSGVWKKDAVLSVLMDSYLSATENETLYLTVRDLFYALRPRYNLIDVRASKKGTELEFDYFSQTIVPMYRRDVHPMEMLEYKARGVFYNPHDGTEAQIGDKELRSWTFPSWTFNKILFVEKQGVWETLKQVGGIEFAKRHDMAIICSEGFSTVAVRKLMAQAQQSEGYQLFVWHDADPSGYEIARTLAEETERMPEHRIKVYDLGVFLEPAIDAGYQSETFTRSKALPTTLKNLSEFERQHFTGTRKNGYSDTKWVDCVRVEINAIPIRERIPYLEAQLAKIPDLLPKVQPPAEVLLSNATDALAESVRARVAEEVDRRLDIDAIVGDAQRRIGTPFALDAAELFAVTRQRLTEKPAQSWRDAMRDEVRVRLHTHLPECMVRDAVSAALEASQ